MSELICFVAHFTRCDAPPVVFLFHFLLTDTDVVFKKRKAIK